MQSSDKRLYQIALTQVAGVGDIIARKLLQIIGDEEAIFKSNRKSLISTGISSKIADEILNTKVLERAEKELNFVEKNKISTYFISDKDYPHRLKDCSDAPILLYFKGNVNFNAEKVISIVGTRKSTSYGNSFCDSFLKDISSIFPDTLIVSGLAYGIDIQTHQSALKYNLPTVGVLTY
ncbi:MAG: DNA-protecting protein DprA [Prevotella sp.]|jgi:DNA processing protein|nr:DNA-protecting protein DprA [Prevotella sp.]